MPDCGVNRTIGSIICFEITSAKQASVGEVGEVGRGKITPPYICLREVCANETRPREVHM